MLQVIHSPRSSYAYAVSREALHLRLQAERGRVSACRVVYGDPFRWNVRHEKTLPKTLVGAQYDYFEGEVSLRDSRYAYYFLLETAEGTYQYGEMGLTQTIDPGSHGERCFHYQHLSESEVFLPPDWVQNSIFYLVFPDRFRQSAGPSDSESRSESDISNNPNSNTTELRQTGWSGDQTHTSSEEAQHDTSHKGGTIAGVRESLGYLQELGVGVLYFTPIFTAQSYHRYDTINYYEIDPMLGSKAEFRRLVEEAHSRGMRVVLDAVFNHCGSEFPQFKDLVAKGADSQYADWFYVRKHPIDMEKKMRIIQEGGWEKWFEHDDGARSLEYETFAHSPSMPRLRTSNPEVQRYCIDIALYWISEFDIDGWRLDVADEVSPDFWRAFRKAVKAAKPSAYILGEVWYDARFWLDGTQFDAVMNYPVLTACIDFFASRRIGAQELSERINDSLMRYQWPVNRAMLNLFESHDTDRFLSLAGDDHRRLLQAYCFIMTLPGAPLFYYGSEVGMTGRMPHGHRQAMNWDSETWNQNILGPLRTCAHLRSTLPALCKGSLEWINYENENILAYTRRYENQRIALYYNRSEESIEIAVESARELVNNTNIQGSLTISPMSFAICEIF